MASGDTDRISALPDDLLHAILGGVSEATAVIRTAVLSKRWQRVWIHAHHLELEDTKVCRDATPAADCRFAGFVDWVFARRGDAGIGSLEITMSQHDCYASPEQVNEWIRYGMRRVAKSFSLELPHRPFKRSRIRRLQKGLPPDDEADAPAAIVLPSHGRVASITLDLAHYRFQLPVAALARYEALTELNLYGVWFDEAAAPGGGRTLGDFVSSCCPCLRNLDVMSPIGLAQLVIRSETLEELELFLADDLHTLDVAAPRLCVLKLRLCFGNIQRLSGNDHAISKRLARIAAPTPRLEEIEIDHFSCLRHPNLDVHDTASVRRLSELHLHMHGPYCSIDDDLRLLEKCPGVEHIGVSLVHGTGATSGGFVDLTTEGAVLFANVRSMEVKAPLISGGQLVSSISSLLSRCPHLRSLSVNITEIKEGLQSEFMLTSLLSCSSFDRAKCFCVEVDTWKFHQKFFLGSLEEVAMRGFIGADEDMELLILLFESSSSIRRVTIHAESADLDLNTTDTKLMNIPCTDAGCWHFGDAVYTWTATQH